MPQPDINPGYAPDGGLPYSSQPTAQPYGAPQGQYPPPVGGGYPPTQPAAPGYAQPPQHNPYPVSGQL